MTMHVGAPGTGPTENLVVLPINLNSSFMVGLVVDIASCLAPPSPEPPSLLPSLALVLGCLSLLPLLLIPAVGVRPHSWQAGARQWALILGKESLQCLPPTKAPFKAQDGVGEGWEVAGTVCVGGSNWLAGQRMDLAVEIPQ